MRYAIRLAFPFGLVHRKIHDLNVVRDDSKSKNMILYQEPSIAIPAKSLANMFLGVGLRVSLLFLVQVYHPILEANQFGIKIWAVQRLPGYVYIYISYRLI